MLGDLLEDRQDWRAEGMGAFGIELRTAVQLIIACGSRPTLWASGLVAWIVRTLTG
jgi:hypothetical protein